MSERDRTWLETAIELSRRCPPVSTAFSVGSIIVDDGQVEMSRGYSRETDRYVHAEESALSKLGPGDSRLATATLYSSLEPCSTRRSRSRSCAQLILESGIPRVVFAYREPSLFVVACRGAEMLEGEGVEVVEISDLGKLVQEVNSHLIIG